MIAQRCGVLIYGGGLIGSAAAKAISSVEKPVTVITKAPRQFHDSNVDWQFGDLNAARPDELLAHREAVVYAAGNLTPASRVSSIVEAVQSEIFPVVQLAEQAARLGVPNFVFISSGGTVYGNAITVPTDEEVRTAPINAYGMIKVQTEQALLEVSRRTGMRVVILRVSNPFGPTQFGKPLGFIAAAIEAALRDEPLVIWGDGLSTRDFVYLDDVAQAITLSTSYQGESAIFNIGSGAEVSLMQVIALVRHVSGVPIVVRHDLARGVDVRRSVLEVTRAREILQWKPSVSIEDGIRRTVEYRRTIVN